MYTYKATNTSNGKFYIGSTTDFEKRKRQHLSCKESYPFQNALRKNPELFEWEVWEDDSKDPALEQALLDMWFGKEQCYNLNPLASVPPSWKGRKQSEEHVKKRTKIQKGRVKSPEECRKISEAKKGKNPWALPDGTTPRDIVEKRAAARIANGKKWTKEQKENASKINRLPNKEITRRLNLIKASELDPEKRGFVGKVANLLGFTRQYAGQFLKKYWREN